jgi:CHASE2 domain-containing sensor protein
VRTGSRSSLISNDQPFRSPFRGLQSFSASDEDAALFFGRDREQDLILANLLASRLTLLYGQSGIGKSSILCAGVVNGLRRPAQSGAGASQVAVVYVNDWHVAPDTTILESVRQEAARLTGEEAEPLEDGLPFDQALVWWTERLDAQLLLIFDQFEQYFLHHPPSMSQAFDRGLADAILTPELRLHCLISLREDALVGLDRFKGEIPNLFGNRLHLQGLSEAAALEAIRRPVERYDEMRGPGQPAVELEPGLAELVVSELQNVVSPLARGRGIPGAVARVQSGEEQPIEPAHLQLVMEALWARDTGAGSKLLRIATLAEMGGCNEIVRSHVEAGLAGLAPKQRLTAARAIRYLITPSGSKVAYTPSDLADYVDAPKANVAELLERLSELRIMRPLPPDEGSSERRYEVFHDLLAAPMLDWRAGVEAQRLAYRMRWLLAALSASIAAALSIAAYSTEPTPLERLELSSIDARFAVRGTVPPDRDIVIVEVDERTLEALEPKRFGLELRPSYAKAIDLILAGKPKVIADDIEFHKAGEESSLLDAIKRANGRIVLVSRRFDTEGDVPLFGREGAGGAGSLLKELNNPRLGFGGLPLDPSGVFRRVQYAAPRVEGLPENRLRTFSVAVAETAVPNSVRRFTGSTLIDYHGPPHTFTSVPMIEVLRGRVRPSAFKDKIVVIGVSAPAGGDLHRTPFVSGATMPGPEIQANAISTVRHGLAFRTAGAGIASLLILVLSLTALLAAPFRSWIALVIFVAVVCAYLLFMQLLFDNGLYLPLVYPLLAWGLAGLGTLFARIYLASQNRLLHRPASGPSASVGPKSTLSPRLEEIGVA